MLYLKFSISGFHVCWGGTLQVVVGFYVPVSYFLFLLHPSVELHCQVWSRLCKAGTTGTEQREDAAEDGGIWFD